MAPSRRRRTGSIAARRGSNGRGKRWERGRHNDVASKMNVVMSALETVRLTKKVPASQLYPFLQRHRFKSGRGRPRSQHEKSHALSDWDFAKRLGDGGQPAAADGSWDTGLVGQPPSPCSGELPQGADEAHGGHLFSRLVQGSGRPRASTLRRRGRAGSEGTAPPLAQPDREEGGADHPGHRGWWLCQSSPHRRGERTKVRPGKCPAPWVLGSLALP